MKISKVKNFSFNLLYGTFSKVISLLFPFIIRTIIIKKLGTEYLGISNLFSAVLQALNLVELGLGSALVFNMYEPIASDNKDKLCAYFNFYKKCYRIIGFFILVAGICIIPFLENLINGSYPKNINLSIVYFIYLINTVLSYWMFSYKNSIALAYQRTDIESKALIISQSLMFSFQIIVLVLFKNYYCYLILLPIFTILKNIIVSFKIDKLYPWIKTKGKVDNREIQELFKKVRALFGHQVAFTVINSADSIALSTLLGLNDLTIYNNYYYIFSAIMSLFTIFFSSIQAGIGNNLLTDNKENVFDNYKKFRLLTAMLIQICIGCFFTLYNPFMKIWMGESLMLENIAVYVFVLGFFITQMRRIVTTYKNAAGLWEPDMIKPYIMIFVDIVLDIILITKIGSLGAMISTIISMIIIAIPWETNVLYRAVFNKKAFEHFGFLIKEFFISIIIIIVLHYTVGYLFIDGIGGLLLRLILTLLITGCLDLLIHCKDTDFLWIIQRIKKLFQYSI